MVSVFDGQLLRSWKYEVAGAVHTLHLYHDTITGVRSATLNHEEIPSSLGTSNLFMDSAGHRISFALGENQGFLEIKRSGWVSFAYRCHINGEDVAEVTQVISEVQDESVFRVKVEGWTVTGPAEEPVVWYEVETVRLSDCFRNVVHRRFKDFSHLNSEIKQTFKGHQLLSSLPAFVEKKSKWIVDHTDPQFLDDRVRRLEIYLAALVQVPHVAETSAISGFLGLMEKVRETSIVINTSNLGLTLRPSNMSGTPAAVGSIQDESVCRGVRAGDLLSKISGQVTGGNTFNGIETCLKHHPRPLVLHFVQSLVAVAESVKEG